VRALLDQAAVVDDQDLPRVPDGGQPVAIMKVVRPHVSRSSASRITASVRESTDDVGSSRMSSGESRRKARAMATRCRSPPDSVWPRSPSTVA
jgi:hypothetical protein